MPGKTIYIGSEKQVNRKYYKLVPMRKRIFITGLIAGTLDIIGACLLSYIIRGTLPSRVLKYIASGVFGKDAMNGGTLMMGMGLLFHYLIAFSCTIIFFWCYWRLEFLKRSVLLNAILIALVAWAVTNLVIIPLSRIHPAPFNLVSAGRAVAILILCIGLPISISATKSSKSE